MGRWRTGSYSHYRRTHTSVVLTRLCVGSLFSRYPSRPAWSLRGSSHTPLRELVVLAVSVTPGVVSSRLFLHAFAWARCSRGIPHARRGLFAALISRLCVGSLFSRYPSRPAWSRRGPLTRLAWACCSRGIRHAWRGLFAALLSRLCVGSLFSGVVVAAPVTGIER